ncbi:MAG: GLUG motif-containing protein [Planctomycetota bacterium]
MNEIGTEPNDWDKHFKLRDDIDLSGFTGPWPPLPPPLILDIDLSENAATSFNIIGSYDNPFAGVFDGNGHDICNFTYSSIGTNYIGLFAKVTGVIKDLGLIDPSVNAATASFIGSLTGNNSGKVINCYAQGGFVSGGGQIGGLVGSNGGTILNSFADSNVAGFGDYVGGLAGDNYMGRIISCYSSGSVDSEANCVGGLTGFSDWIISESYATGSVSGRDNIGGLVGYNQRTFYSTPSGTVAKCYAVGTVSATINVGGLIGFNDSGPVYSSFWDTQTTEQATSDGGMPRTTAEMQDPNTFIEYGWDFVGEYENGPNDDWAMPVSGGYPVLSWQLGESLPLPDFSGGFGEPNNPYLISTPNDLSRIGHNPRLMNAHFKLTNDVNMADTTHFIIGNGMYPFAGTFDGGGHLISNFYRYSSTGEMTKGLFGIVNGTGAEIKNVGLIDSYISGGGYQMVGLLVGRLLNGTVSGCFAERGRVEVFESDGGGLVGSNVGTISNCYANVYISGWVGVGGLVQSNSGIISNCYSRGRVDGLLDGGLVESNSGPVTNSFWDVNSSGEPTSAGGTGLMTADMQTMSTFTNARWDFVGETANGTDDIWAICNHADYPRLTWQFVIGDFDGDGDNDFRDFALYAMRWHQADAGFFCGNGGTDLTNDDYNGFTDLKAFTENWLTGWKLIIPGQASNPNPPDGASIGDFNADLSWKAGPNATSHDVYFGTGSPPPFICNQTSTTFDPGTMTMGAKYYWRINEVGSYETTMGPVWNFTIMTPPL